MTTYGRKVLLLILPEDVEPIAGYAAGCGVRIEIFPAKFQLLGDLAVPECLKKHRSAPPEYAPAYSQALLLCGDTGLGLPVRLFQRMF